MFRQTHRILLGLCLPGLALAMGCVTVGHTETRHVSLPDQGAADIQLSVSMGVGELELTGSDADLLEGSFKTNVNSWMPEVDYQLRATSTGVLKVHCPDEGDGIPVGDAENEWDLEVNRHLPTELHIELGVGSVGLDLAPTNLTKLRLDLGIGEARVDLGRVWTHDVAVSADVGIGEIRFVVPRGMNVRIHAEVGIGSVSAPGFERKGDDFVRAANPNGPTLTVYADVGIGEVRFVTAKEDYFDTTSVASLIRRGPRLAVR